MKEFDESNFLISSQMGPLDVLTFGVHPQSKCFFANNTFFFETIDKQKDTLFCGLLNIVFFKHLKTEGLKACFRNGQNHI